MKSNRTSCPCGSGQAFSSCCEPCLNDPMAAQTAEQLMRSRYTAYTLKREDYLLASWHTSTRPASLGLGAEPVKWIGLKVLRTEAGQADDAEGVVQFVAKYKLNGKAHRIEETSRFVRENGRWFYLDAV